jgi:7,8-dihydropterin-6-yl-methyl-4-(beta-D-ribofuranosyl)aminobenzene 5'-phosphate synthase
VDAGSDQALLSNSAKLGIDLNMVDSVFITHGHFDHTGALLPLLQKHGPKTVYSHSQIFGDRPLPLPNGKFKPVGCPFNRSDLENAGANFVFVDKFAEILPNIYISGEIPRDNDFENAGGNFKRELNGELYDDQIADDMAMIINHPEGLIIISGCAHAGIINILRYAVRMTGKERILAFIGGTHLMTASEARLEKTITAIRELNIDRLIVAHCTGFKAAARLYSELGPMVQKGDAGMRYKF